MNKNILDSKIRNTNTFSIVSVIYLVGFLILLSRLNIFFFAIAFITLFIGLIMNLAIALITKLDILKNVRRKSK